MDNGFVRIPTQPGGSALLEIGERARSVSGFRENFTRLSPCQPFLIICGSDPSAAPIMTLSVKPNGTEKWGTPMTKNGIRLPVVRFAKCDGNGKIIVAKGPMIVDPRDLNRASTTLFFGEGEILARVLKDVAGPLQAEQHILSRLLLMAKAIGFSFVSLGSANEAT
jgi:hypothetical protein